MGIRRHHDFLRIGAGQAVSGIGDGVHRIAVLWWAKQATGSNLVVVGVALATALPEILAAPFAGWLVDRIDRRRLMIASDLVRCAATATLALLAGSGLLRTPSVIALAVVVAVAGCVFSPAWMASITMLVPEAERASANSFVGVTDAVAGIVGPALGGLAVGLWGTASALWFDAGTFAVSFLLVAASRVPMPASAVPHGSRAGGALAGLDLLRRDRSLRDLTVVATGLNLFVAPIPVVLVALAAGPFRLHGGGYGLLAATIPLGMVAGFVLAPMVIAHRGSGLVALTATSVAIAATGSTTLAVAGGCSLVAAGVGIGVANTILPTRFQQGVDPALQGRVFALLGALTQVGRPVGLVLAAPLLAGVGPRGAMAACGASMLVVTLAGRRGLLGAVPDEEIAVLTAV